MPFINGKYYMNPQYGAALERARQNSEGKSGRILSVLEDIFDEIINSSEKHSKSPFFGHGDSGPSSPPDSNNPSGTPPAPRNGIVPISVPVSELYADRQNGSVQSPAQQQPQSHTQNSTDGHWVTMNHRHVFIQESSGGQGQHPQQAPSQPNQNHTQTPPNTQTQGKVPTPANQQKRKDIADIAGEYNHSTGWAFDKKKDDFPVGSNKCNKFVYDVTTEAGAKPIVIGKDGKPVVGEDGKPRPPLAAEWADRNTQIANWRVLQPGETPEPGDVAAYKLPHEPGHAPYTGHSGIVTSVDSDGTVHAIAAHDSVIGPDDKFQTTDKNVHFRRYTGN